jgi:hypothetical protein
VGLCPPGEADLRHTPRHPPFCGSFVALSATKLPQNGG